MSRMQSIDDVIGAAFDAQVGQTVSHPVTRRVTGETSGVADPLDDAIGAAFDAQTAQGAQSISKQDPFGFGDLNQPFITSQATTETGFAPRQVATLPNGQVVLLDSTGRPLNTMAITPRQEPGFVENVGRGFMHGLAMALPRGLPGVEAWQEAESIRSPGEGVGGTIGGAVASLAGVVNPTNAAETALSTLVAGPAMKSVASPLIGVIERRFGARAASMLGNAIEEGGEEATFAAVQQAQTDADLWFTDPAKALGNVMIAAGTAGALGAGMGAPMGIRGHSAEQSGQFRNDPALVQEAVAAMQPGPTQPAPVETATYLPSPPQGAGKAGGSNPLPLAEPTTRDAASIEQPSPPPSRPELEARARELGVQFNPRMRTADLAAAVESARTPVPPASSQTTQPQTQTGTPEAASASPTPSGETNAPVGTSAANRLDAQTEPRRAPAENLPASAVARTQPATVEPTQPIQPATQTVLGDVPSPQSTPDLSTSPVVSTKEEADALDRKNADQTVRKGIYSSRKDINAAERRLLGFDELDSPGRQSWGEANEKAEAEGIPERAVSLASSILEKPRGLSAVETAGINQRIVGNLKRMRELRDAIAEAGEGYDFEANAREYADLEAQVELMTRANDLSGTEKGRALNSQKMALYETMEPAILIARAKINKKEALTSQERAKFEQMSADYAKLEKQLADLQQSRVNADTLEVLRQPGRKRSKTPEARKAEYTSLVGRFKELQAKGCD